MLGRRIHYRQCIWTVVASCLFGLATIVEASAQDTIDPVRSTITVHVFKAGMFRGFADDHVVRAPIAGGSVETGVEPHVELIVDVGGMRVLDPGLSPHDRDQVQNRMLGPEVLDANRFDRIRFESTMVQRVAGDGWIVRGRLTLHGQTHPIVVKVARDGERFDGSVVIRQTDFGIVPIKVAGGLVTVKDAVTVDFDIVRAGSTSTPEATKIGRRDVRRHSDGDGKAIAPRRALQRPAPYAPMD